MINYQWCINNNNSSSIIDIAHDILFKFNFTNLTPYFQERCVSLSFLSHTHIHHVCSALKPQDLYPTLPISNIHGNKGRRITKFTHVYKVWKLIHNLKNHFQNNETKMTPKNIFHNLLVLWMLLPETLMIFRINKRNMF